MAGSLILGGSKPKGKKTPPFSAPDEGMDEGGEPAMDLDSMIGDMGGGEEMAPPGDEMGMDVEGEVRMEAARELATALGLPEDKAAAIDNALKTYIENCK